MLRFEELSSSGKSLSMPDLHTIWMARDFSPVPFGRYREDGPESGEVFREDVLIPALRKHDRVLIEVDGVEGLPSSFWEETMGGLVRRGWEADEVRRKLDVHTSDPDLQVYVRLGWKYLSEAEREAANSK